MHVTQHGRSVTVFYHPNSLKQTQSIRAPEANCWRFTCCLDTQQVRTGMVDAHAACKYHGDATWVCSGCFFFRCKSLLFGV